MLHPVVQFGQLAMVPSVCRSHEIARYSLQAVYVMAATFGASLKVCVGVLVPTFHATVAVMVYGAIAHVQLVHHVHHAFDYVGVVRGVSINLHVEYMATASEVVIGRLHFGFVAR